MKNVIKNPKISVIIPVYNGEDYIAECLDSIIDQTLGDIEIICVNDGSIDNSLSILKEYAFKDNRIKIINKKNEGQGYARKVGLDSAIGDYILFCDQDDKFFSNDSFQMAFDRIEKYNTDIAIFKFAYWNEETIRDIYEGYNTNLEIFSHINEKYLLFHWFAPWLKIYRKTFLNKYDWYFPKFAFIEDPPFHVQILLRANKITFLNKILYLHRTTNPNSITNRKKYTNKHALAFCDFTEKIKFILIEENTLEEYRKEFIYFIVTQSFAYINSSNFDLESIIIIKKFIKKYDSFINFTISNYPLKVNLYPILSRKEIFYIKAILKFSDIKLVEYLYKKYRHSLGLKKYSNIRNLIIKNKDLSDKIELQNQIIKQKDNQNNIQNLLIKRLQNSWSYRIGRLFTYPLSILLEFYKFICDYNLIEKSGLFDSEYYLSQNEDVKKAKMNPIKHYLQFGWKEGRNPSVEFDGNKYLNKRPDVQIAGFCPLVHYLRFGREEENEKI